MISRHRKRRTPNDRSKGGHGAVECSTIAHAIAILGGEAALAAWLQIPRAELRSMARHGAFDRGFFGQITLSLQNCGFTPAPALFGLRSWEPLIMPVKGTRCSKPKPSRRTVRKNRQSAVGCGR